LLQYFTGEHKSAQYKTLVADEQRTLEHWICRRLVVINSN